MLICVYLCLCALSVGFVRCGCGLCSQKVYSNITGKPYASLEDLKQKLIDQVVSPVRFDVTLDQISLVGGPIFEIGPGEQLKAMLKRIDREAWKRAENVH